MVEDNFIWRKVSKKDREKIKQEAKEIMDSFSEKISSLKNLKELLVEEEVGERKEKEGKSCDNSFREKMFVNAPCEDGFIIAEKKSW